jgi:hypothetical protein
MLKSYLVLLALAREIAPRPLSEKVGQAAAVEQIPGSKFRFAPHSPILTSKTTYPASGRFASLYRARQ